MLDRSVKATGDDAMLAKLATTKAGYYVDPFLDAFSRSSSADDSKNSSSSETASRGQTANGRRRVVQPLIKRGTHARVCVMDRAISTFLKMDEELPCQVVILGAGKDTSYFRYRNGNLMGMNQEEEQTQNKGSNAGRQPPRRVPRHRQADSTTNQREVHWYEVDHVSVVTEKATLIRKSNLLKSFCPLLVKTETGYESGASSGGLGSLSGGLGSLSSSSKPSPTYRLIGHDLRESPTILLEKINLNPTLPTLFIMECVSMYIPITESKSLLQALSLSSDTVYIACYEPIIGMGDPFGRVMERNLVKKGIASPDCCLLQTRTLKDQLQKLVDAEGFRRSVGCNMWNAYETIVTAAQRQRANQSEFMDEYEEWILIMQHYCLVVAQGGRSSSSGDAPPLSSPWTMIRDPGADDKKQLSLGWVSGKCSQLETE